MRLTIFALAAAAFGAALPASAQTAAEDRAERERRDCVDEAARNRCEAGQHRQLLQRYGLPPIETHLAGGDTVRRIFFVNGYGLDIVALSWVRRRGQEPQLSVHFPGEGSQPLGAPVPERQWRLIEIASRNFDRRFEPRAEDDDRICIHGWTLIVEATDPPDGPERGEAPRLRRKVEDACSDGPAGQFASVAADEALLLLPPCMLLDPRQHRGAASQLAACTLLSGDRYAAARAFNAAYSLRFIDVRSPAGAAAELFDEGSALVWPGRTAAIVGDAAAAFWVEQFSGDESAFEFSIWGVRGEGPRRAIVAGAVGRSVRVSGRSDEQAAMEQVWVDDGDGWSVERITVGPFRRRQ